MNDYKQESISLSYKGNCWLIQFSSVSWVVQIIKAN